MKSFLWKLYVYTFIGAFLPVMPLFPLLFKAHGLDAFQISILIAFWSFVVIVLQIPTGALADKFSRRNLLILSSIAQALCFLTWLIFPSFIGFAIGFVFWGIRNTLSSGTLESFIYDEQKALGEHNLYEKVRGRVQAANYASLMMSTVLGGFLSVHNFAPALIISILTPLLAPLVLITIQPIQQLATTPKENLFLVLKRAMAELRVNHILLFLVIITAVLSGLYIALDDFWSLIYNSFGLGTSAIGIAMATIYGLGGIAGYTSHYLQKGNKFLPYLLVFLSGLLLFTVGLLKLVVLIPLTFLAIYLFKVSEIKFEAIFQHAIQSDQRATIFSLKGFIYEFVYMGSILLFGSTATGIGLKAVLVIVGVIATATVCLGVIIQKQLVLSK